MEKVTFEQNIKNKLAMWISRRRVSQAEGQSVKRP